MSDERTKSDDQARLDRLFEYTKFHIGIYIAAAGAMITIAGSEHLQDFFDGLCMPFLWAAIAAMVLAGMAGGLIASSCASAKTFDEVWHEPILFWPVSKLLVSKVLHGPRGLVWARVEHLAFWASVLLFGAAVLWR